MKYQKSERAAEVAGQETAKGRRKRKDSELEGRQIRERVLP